MYGQDTGAHSLKNFNFMLPGAIDSGHQTTLRANWDDVQSWSGASVRGLAFKNQSGQKRRNWILKIRLCSVCWGTG